MVDDSPDTKIRQAEVLIVQARVLFGQARNLLREAGVPYIASMLHGADFLVNEAIRLAKVVVFDSYDDDEEITDERPTRPVERVA